MAESFVGMRLVVGPDRVALCGRFDEVLAHCHSTAAVVVGVDRPLGFVAQRKHESRAALLAPSFMHALDVREGRMAVFLLPPQVVSGAGLSPLRDLPHPSRWLDLAHALERGELDSFETVDRVLAQERLPIRPLDERLSAATAVIARNLGENLPIEELASEVGLSASRLMELAREHLGTSLRAYRRWLRTFRVAQVYARGGSLTEAALEAGFASSAHLSIAAREHFGIRPSQVLSPVSRAGITVLD